jgi:protocatechuate 3,4-dioxygenase, beta subunit
MKTSKFSRRSFLAAAGAGSLLYTVRGAFAEQLVLTPDQTIGPYYPDKMPLDLDNDLLIINDAITPAVGSVTWITGRVLDQSGSPVRGALVEIWQADNNGAYIHSASPIANRDRNFQGYGRFITASSGEYLFRTVKPGLYPGRTRHIHYKITYPGGRVLTTQLYVQGEALNNSDGVLNGIRDTAQRASVIKPFSAVPGSVMGELGVNFDIILGYTPSDTASSTSPTIFAMNGVVHGGSYQPNVAAGSWISIFGSNLAPSSRPWASSDIVNGHLPSSLDGVSVSVAGQPAPVYYISPSQLNVEVPSTVSGSATVQVSNANGSATATVNVASMQPGFFQFRQQYIAAVRADGAYIGPANLIDGTATVPAKAGDQLLLFGTGFGLTNPPVASGDVVTAAVPLANPVKVHIHNTDAAVSYAGLTAAGLYQINITVPNLAAGDHPVTASVNGVWTQAMAKLRIE